VRAVEPATLTGTLAGWAARLAYADVPERVSAYATSLLISQIATVRASLRHPFGPRIRRALGAGARTDPKALSCLLAGLSTCLYLEDSMYTGHVAHSTVTVPLAYLRDRRLDGRALLTAVIAASESAARVAATATLGPFRGQSASYVHLVGAVAGRLRAEDAPPDAWVNAWGLALAAPPWPLTRAFVGSDAKVLSSAAPVRTALDACDAARAGFRGAPDILEHPHGFLAKFAQVPLPEYAAGHLGTRWHLDTLTFKVHPAGAYVDAAIDCAIEIHRLLAPAELGRIAEVVAYVPRLALEMDVLGQQYLAADRSSIMALNTSIGYNVATALLTGSVRPADLAAPGTADPRRWELAAKVRPVHDRALGSNLLRATAPLGEALRGAGAARAGGWLHDFAGLSVRDILADTGPSGDTGPSERFASATKATGARLRVRLSTGEELEFGVAAPVGAAGPGTRRDHAAIVRRKLLGTGARAEHADRLRAVSEMDHERLAALIDEVLLHDVLDGGEPDG
jgi:2-methylcitrate dehydratase PrpD